MLSVGDLRGLWTRSLIAWPDGRRDVSTLVSWLQGPSLFADLRQPPGVFEGIAASCRNALSAADCLALAQCQGFAGRFEARDKAFEWVRRLDIHPKQAVRDIGRLFWREQVLVEEGVEAEYTEHWHRETGVPDPLSGALWLHDVARGVSGCVLRAGRWFAYARGRELQIAGGTLAELVEAAGSQRQMQALVDCEISFGTVDGWRISRSSLPYKVGWQFGARRLADRLVLPDLDAAGRRIARVWDITEQEGDISGIFDAIPQVF